MNSDAVSRSIEFLFRPPLTPDRRWLANDSAKRTYFIFQWILPSQSGPYMRALRPKMVVIAETEFWPNFLRLAHGSGARVAVVNARISDRSWPNYRRFRWLLRSYWQMLICFWRRHSEDAARLQEIGARAGTRSGHGEFEVRYGSYRRHRQSWTRCASRSLTNASRPVLVCGSTVEGEEPLLLKAFENLLVQHPRGGDDSCAAASGALSRGGCAARTNVDSASGADRYGRASLWTAAFFCSIRSANWRRCMLLPTSRSSAAAWCRAAGTISLSRRNTAWRSWSEIIRRIFATSSRLFQGRDAVRIVGPAELPLVLMELLANDTERKLSGRRAAETMRSQTGRYNAHRGRIADDCWQAPMNHESAICHLRMRGRRAQCAL